MSAGLLEDDLMKLPRYYHCRTCLAILLLLALIACSSAPYKYEPFDQVDLSGRAVAKEQGAFRVRASVHTVGGLSAHGDQNDLTRWYEGFENRPPVCLVHGEPHAAKAFAGRLEGTGARWVKRARPGMRVDLSQLEQAPSG